MRLRIDWSGPLDGYLPLLPTGLRWYSVYAMRNTTDRERTTMAAAGGCFVLMTEVGRPRYKIVDDVPEFLWPPPQGITPESEPAVPWDRRGGYRPAAVVDMANLRPPPAEPAPGMPAVRTFSPTGSGPLIGASYGIRVYAVQPGDGRRRLSRRARSRGY